MECPKCGYVHDAPAIECARCGVIVAKAVRRVQPGDEAAAGAALPTSPVAAQADGPDDELSETVEEVWVRSLGVPLALLAASVVHAQLPFVSQLFTMWIHEAGHAVSAWVTGYFAVPGPWMTPVGSERAAVVTLGLLGGLGWGAYEARQRNRRFWMGAAVLGIGLVVAGRWGLTHDEAQQVIVFGGDGGAFVLGSLLMLTLYARRSHPMRREGLRWVFVVIGAIAVVDARASWSGSVGDIPFGADERGLSDPSVLVEQYNWSVSTLMWAYAQVSAASSVLLGAGYLAGLLGAMRAVPQRPSVGPVEANPKP